MRISDWSSDVCSSDLGDVKAQEHQAEPEIKEQGKHVVQHFFHRNFPLSSSPLSSNRRTFSIAATEMESVIVPSSTCSTAWAKGIFLISSCSVSSGCGACWLSPVARRSEERGVGKEGVSRCGSRWS